MPPSTVPTRSSCPMTFRQPRSIRRIR
jgi:hypothetical protein